MNALPHVTAVHGQDHITVFGNFDPPIEGYFSFGQQHIVWLAHTRACRHDAPTNHECTGETQAAQNKVAALHACAPAAR